MSSTVTSVSAQEVRDYRRELANAPRYLHVVCLRCGLIVDRRRKATDLRTPEELYERVMCGNCRARSVLGEIIFSFDGGGTFYERATVQNIPDLEPIEMDPPKPNWPPWKPIRYVRSEAPYVAQVQERTTIEPSTHRARQSSCDNDIDWMAAALTAAGFAVLAGVGVLVLQGLRMVIYIFAVAFDG
ncbi:MAG: hypothetical protein ABMA14_12920 [Hyphomonadaceae bacterium]